MLVTLAPAAHGGVGDDDVILNNKTSQVVDNMSVDNDTLLVTNANNNYNVNAAIRRHTALCMCCIVKRATWVN